jgi:DNA-binding transcriptional ArsR family regulator
MSFSLHLSNFSSEQIAFGYSAAHETLVALHVYFDCKHHPLHIPWVINARKKISPGLKEEIEAFSLFYKRPIVTFWDLQEDSAIHSFEFDLNRLVDKPIQDYYERIIESILNRQISSGNYASNQKLQQEFIDKTLERYPQSKEMVVNLLENPTESRQRFVNLLESFWNTCLKDEWPKMEELFLKDISYRGMKLLKEGPLSLLASLSQEIVIHPNEKRAVIRRISKADIYFDEKDMLFLAPSYFAWPHLFVNRNKPVGINYSIMEVQHEARKPMPPESLLKFFRAMSDLTRLQMIQYLARKPRSTRELAGLIGVTEGAISKHLKQLQDAGLITSKRESYYVFYQLIEKPFTDFSLGLLQFIKQDHGEGL